MYNVFFYFFNSLNIYFYFRSNLNFSILCKHFYFLSFYFFFFLFKFISILNFNISRMKLHSNFILLFMRDKFQKMVLCQPQFSLQFFRSFENRCTYYTILCLLLNNIEFIIKVNLLLFISVSINNILWIMIRILNLLFNLS